jgi:hypothetical protein
MQAVIITQNSNLWGQKVEEDYLSIAKFHTIKWMKPPPTGCLVKIAKYDELIIDILKDQTFAFHHMSPDRSSKSFFVSPILNTNSDREAWEDLKRSGLFTWKSDFGKELVPIPGGVILLVKSLPIYEPPCLSIDASLTLL